MDVGRLQKFEGKITAQGKLLLHGQLLCLDSSSYSDKNSSGGGGSSSGIGGSSGGSGVGGGGTSSNNSNSIIKPKELQVFLFEQNIIFSEIVGKKTQFTNPSYIYKNHIQV